MTNTVLLPTIESAILTTAQMDGQPLAIADDGGIGTLDKGTLCIEAYVPEHVHGIFVNRSRYAELLPFDEMTHKGVASKVYKLEVEIKMHKHGSYTTIDDNSLRLATLTPTGKLTVYQVSVVGQHGKFWVVTKEAYNEQVYKNTHRSANGRLMAKYMSWKAHHVFRDMLEGDLSQIPADSWNAHKRHNRPVDISDCAEDEGRVIFFGDANGIGTVMTHQGPAKVYWGTLTARPRDENTDRRFLRKGEKIRFRNGKKPHGKSRLKTELVGVEVIETVEN